MKNKSLFLYLINLSFFLYFLILIVERALSITLSLINGVDLFGNLFNIYTYSLVVVSFIGWLVYLLIRCRGNIKALFKKDDEVSFKDLCIASGILLLSGMVHTEYTIPVIQFISYGILIIGILLKVIINSYESNNKLLLWLSFSYLVAFSMAIPVMYRTNIAQYALFHVLEAIASLSLVGIFTYLMILLFDKTDNLFLPYPLLIMVALDTLLIVLRWQEEINYFVLIFAILSLVLFIFGFVIAFKNKKQNQNN